MKNKPAVNKSATAKPKLQKLLADSGLGSRRGIETWIKEGRVVVNGNSAKLGDRAVWSDKIQVDGEIVEIRRPERRQAKVIMYHKPEGEICTRDDPQKRPTIFDSLPAITQGRWVTVGRLDINTSGLLLVTNDGELANTLMHPSSGLEREYLVRVRGRATHKTIDKLIKGVRIDGKLANFKSVVPLEESGGGANHWYRVVITEGRYREVRKMWQKAQHTVSRLKRIRYGTIKLTRDIAPGQHKKIAPMQLEKLIASTTSTTQGKQRVSS